MARFLKTQIICTLLSISVAVANAQNSQQTDDNLPMELMQGRMDNLLPIKGQRFRIDAEVEEITLLFFRDQGSAPLILIKPDGSKWYHSDYPLERVTWYTDPSFDMIKIIDPVPGPWQVAGRVDEENKAVIVSEVRFEAEPLPQQLFENERLKVEGTLYNGDTRVSTARFREAVLLDVLFVSSNNPDYDNFGAEPTRVAEFSDNGQGYDEVAGDGVFTGRYALRVVPGEYIPTYQLETPLYERSFEGEAVVVEKQPVRVDFVLAEERGADNFLTVELEQDLVKPTSVVVNGSVNYPNGEQRRFSVTDVNSFPHSIPLDNLTYGKHLVELTIFATSQKGREIELQFDNLSFISVEPIEQLTDAEQAQQNRQQVEREAELRRQQRAAEERQLMMNLIIVAVVNIVLVGLAIAVVWWKRRQKSPVYQQQKAAAAASKANKKAAKKLAKDNANKGKPD